MTDFVQEHPLLIESRARRFAPGGENGHTSTLTEMAAGDWSYKPHRDRRFGPNLATFRGVPKGAAELYGRTTYHVR